MRSPEGYLAAARPFAPNSIRVIFRTDAHAARGATADENACRMRSPEGDLAAARPFAPNSIRVIFRTVGAHGRAPSPAVGLAVAMAAALWTQAGLALWLDLLVLGYIYLMGRHPAPAGGGQGQPHRAAVLAWLGGLALGALGLLPLLLSRGLGGGTRVVFTDHFVYPHQLLLAGWGNGPSIPGPDDTLTFQLGLIACGLAVLGIGLLATDHARRSHSLASCLFVLILSLLSTTLAAPLWKLLPFLARPLTYPWQLLLLTGPWLAWLAGLGGRTLLNLATRPADHRTVFHAAPAASAKPPCGTANENAHVPGTLPGAWHVGGAIFRTVPLCAALIALALLGAYGDLQPQTTSTPVPDTPIAIFGEDEIALLAVTSAGVPGPAGQITVLARWQALRLPAQDYTVFFHVETLDGTVWGQQDTMPQAGQLPTSQWRPGQVVTDQYQVRLKPDAPVGADYRYLLGLYQWQTGQRLRVGADDKVVVTP